MLCFKQIRSRVRYPEELTLHEIAGTSAFVSKSSGGAVVETDFEAKNGFGVKAGYSATCTYPRYGDATIKMFERR